MTATNNQTTTINRPQPPPLTVPNPIWRTSLVAVGHTPAQKDLETTGWSTSKERTEKWRKERRSSDSKERKERERKDKNERRKKDTGYKQSALLQPLRNSRTAQRATKQENVETQIEAKHGATFWPCEGVTKSDGQTGCPNIVSSLR